MKTQNFKLYVKTTRFFLPKIILLHILTLSILNSCSNNGVNPNEQLKDPREMTWTADTIRIPDTAIQLIPEDIIVNSSDDIWLAVWVGHGQIWHYNGNKWSVVEDIGGGVNCLTKKNNFDLWAGGRIGRPEGHNVAVANYINGKWTWNEMTIKGEILDMSTDPHGNIWACGRNGLVMEYSNNKWVVDTVKVPLGPNDGYFFLHGIEYYNGKVYVVGNKTDLRTNFETHYYFSGDIKKWILEDSMVFNNPNINIKWGNWALHRSDDNELYSYGLQGIWKYENKLWKQSFYISGEIWGMYALRKNYIFGLSAFNEIYFYDGSSWQLISALFKNNDTYFTYYLIKVVNQEIYIVGFGVINNKDVVILYHGK